MLQVLVLDDTYKDIVDYICSRLGYIHVHIVDSDISVLQVLVLDDIDRIVAGDGPTGASAHVLGDFSLSLSLSLSLTHTHTHSLSLSLSLSICLFPSFSLALFLYPSISRFLALSLSDSFFQYLPLSLCFSLLE